MEGVDHVDIVKVGGGGLIGEVNGVLERHIPDGEGLKLRIACVHAAAVLMIKLAQAGCHFAAARAGCGDDDEAALGLNIIVLAEAVFRHDKLDIRGVIGNYIVAVDTHAERFEPLLEHLCCRLTAVVGDDDAADIQADAAEGVDKAQCVLVVGDAEVAAALVALDIIRRDGDDYLRIVLHLEQHPHLAVRPEAGQNTGGVVVVKQLAAEFKVQLAAELRYPVTDILRLQLHIFGVVKSYLIHVLYPLYLRNYKIKLYTAAPSAVNQIAAKIKKE